MADSILWHWQDVLKAVGSAVSGDGPEMTGVSIDSRTLQQGDLFVPISEKLPAPYNQIQGARNGHDFMASALDRGASAGLVSRSVSTDLPLIEVDDTFQALWRLGQYARNRLATDSSVVAVTGSSGKTTLRAWLEAVFSDQFPTHASVNSYNNHLGVPLSLARMPANTAKAIFEVGCNHPGEIKPLANLVRPDIAVVLNVLPVHIGHFRSIDELRREKLSIADGLETGGVLVLHEDLPAPANVKVISFGLSDRAEVQIVSIDEFSSERSRLKINVLGQQVLVDLPVSGRHWALTTAACLAVLSQAGGNLDQAAQTLSGILIPQGRGDKQIVNGVSIIDESYNANPASMLQAITNLKRQDSGRQFAILGEMLELGEQSSQDHDNVLMACQGIDRLITVGDHFSAGQGKVGQDHYQSAQDIDIASVVEWLRPGDTLLVKGSNAVFWGNEFVTKIRTALA
ncbi:MAG: UDP-N-acetylmuramoyl-tripeptide--D-alanyl-D-alanine ligase [Gammaproteobacteria bacterium]|jgi:UDP-N-acetylmuramoyl-tripeptide--D-alanyl-D-alanine ligase|nr:UDP-N-acetylmuramoyl-tripeptide--D-alanyl-D-alanine ligase [Gammaproteobacteria bacterium]MBT5203850.1 UDP-N-acetylmuramoyl-tripeptide--D-alanyl-D-alanine ligase [Gammaproteobacteria bacterium]MBT5601651.1 UDP-N-acetylmuramoyl-tripeptide--D-alanyl-D-alanine ligase [Gammaproteobacteria bacterium]MBT6244642.1 UDP-N-acetylmuramoyl-tripeptide--D-alanyl-D-alanine ligase [Gammaproteobacteria bacterium]